MIRTLLLGSAAAALLAGAATAADLPRKSAPVAPAFAPVPVFAWTGFYAGVNAGYGFGQFAGPSAGGFKDPSGFVGGAQIGYNRQVGRLVYGLETDLSYANVGADNSATGIAGSKARVDYIGTVRGRVGYAMDRFLPYFTGGFAYGGSSVRIQGNQSEPIHDGGTLGVGAEYAITNNLTAKVEGLYVDLADRRVLGGTGKVGAELGIVRAGLNYKF